MRGFTPGTEICLVVDESNDLGTPEGSFDPNASIVPAQFIDWEGDIQDSQQGSDKGVIFFTMEADRTIVARLEPKVPLIVRTDGGADGTGTAVETEFLFQNPLTIPPVHTGNTTASIAGTGLTGQAGIIQLNGWFNDATQLRLCVPPGAAFTAWSGDGAVSGRCVDLTFANGAEVLLQWP